MLILFSRSKLTPGPRLVLVTILLGLSFGSTAYAEEFIYLGAGPVLGDRARQVRVGPGGAAFVAAGWQGPDFDDRSWVPPEPPPASPAPLAPSASSAPLPQAAPPSAPASPDGGPPPCTGTLYLRRRFDVGPELSRLASLLLRVRYEDGFAAYVNGVEVARRRLPDAALTEPSTLANDRSPTEPENYYVPVSRGLLRARDNLLAMEVHPRTLERCPRMDAELSAADGPRVVRGPYIEGLSASAIDLSVESDVPTAIDVRYGKGEVRTARDRRIGDRAATTMHRVHLEGLRAGTTYHYQIALHLAEGSTTDLPETSFHTPPAAGRSLRFIIYGDSRSGHEVHAQVVQSLLAEDPDLVLSTGDVVERGTEEGDWDRFFRVAAPLLRRVAVYMVPGNHEYARRGLGAARLFDLFATMFPLQQAVLGEGEPAGQRPPREVMASPPRGPVGGTAPEGDRGYYSFDVAGVHFVGLDSNQYRSPRQQRWFEDDLDKASARHPRAIFVWAHEGPYSAGWHGDSSEAIRNYVPICERYNVTMFFSGHDHDYERGRRGRLSYVVTGGAGAELRPLRCGVPGKRRCKNPPAIFVNDHNYVRVEVLPGQLKLCAKRIDGTPLEPCVVTRLSH
jgi:hypothetical protein